MPEAPVRFSTMNCCFSDSESLPANRRASGSTEPPGGYGETNFTTLVGQSCANAVPQRKRTRGMIFLKTDIASSFEFQHLPRVIRRGDDEAELFQYAARLAHLLGIRFRE